MTNIPQANRFSRALICGRFSQLIYCTQCIDTFQSFANHKKGFYQFGTVCGNVINASMKYTLFFVTATIHNRVKFSVVKIPQRRQIDKHVIVEKSTRSNVRLHLFLRFISLSLLRKTECVFSIVASFVIFQCVFVFRLSNKTQYSRVPWKIGSS